MTFNELKRHKLAAADGIPPFLKFLNCIHPLSPEYTAIWNSKIISNEISDFNTLLRHYRDYRRFTDSQQRSGAAHSAFNATLNGRDTEGIQWVPRPVAMTLEARVDHNLEIEIKGEENGRDLVSVEIYTLGCAAYT